VAYIANYVDYYHMCNILSKNNIKDYTLEDLKEFKESINIFIKLEKYLGDIIIIDYVNALKNVNKGSQIISGYLYDIDPFYSISLFDDNSKYYFIGAKTILKISDVYDNVIFKNEYIVDKLDKNLRLNQSFNRILRPKTFERVIEEIFGKIACEIYNSPKESRERVRKLFLIK